MRELSIFNAHRQVSSHICPKHDCNLVIWSTELKKGTLSREFCEICEMEERNARTARMIKKGVQHRDYAQNGAWLFQKSIIDDASLKLATFDNFVVKNQQQANVIARVVEFVEQLKSGHRFNVVLTGNAGNGKSHLSYAMLKELNEQKDAKCLFVNTASLFTRLRSVFDGNRQWTEYSLIEPIKQADFVVLDDVGSEVGKINASTQASDYITRTLYEILNARQNKVTIWNTNLDSKTLEQIYDIKIVSRLLLNTSDKIVKFNWDDRRVSA